jgi:hypothetical protein
MYVHFEGNIEFNVENVCKRIMKCGEFKKNRWFFNV